MKRIYTSEEILKSDNLYKLAEQSANLLNPKYKMTEGEIEYFHFIDSKYSIGDYIREFSEEDENGNLILTLDAMEMGKALTDDGSFPKAVCLSDETALQKIFFWCAVNLKD